MGQAALEEPQASSADKGAVALRAFFNIAKAWGLDEKEQMSLLGLTSRSTLQSWKAGKVSRLDRDKLERISYILGIYKALHILLPVRQIADEWVHQPNTAPIFGGRSALDRMTAGNVADLQIVRQYLDAELG